MIDAQLVERALEKITHGEALGGFAAVFDRATGESDLDGDRWRLVVAFEHEVGEVEVTLSGTEGAKVLPEIAPEVIERAVEARAVNRFPAESRFRDLLAASPLRLVAEEFN